MVQVESGRMKMVRLDSRKALRETSTQASCLVLIDSCHPEQERRGRDQGSEVELECETLALDEAHILVGIAWTPKYGNRHGPIEPDIVVYLIKSGGPCAGIYTARQGYEKTALGTLL